MSREDRRIPLYIEEPLERPPPLEAKKEDIKRGSAVIDDDSLKDLLIIPDIIE